MTTTLRDELNELTKTNFKLHKDLIDEHYPFLLEYIIKILKERAKYSYVSEVEIGNFYVKDYYDNCEKYFRDLTPFGLEFHNFMKSKTDAPTLIPFVPSLNDLEHLISKLEQYLKSQGLQVKYISHCNIVIDWD